MAARQGLWPLLAVAALGLAALALRDQQSVAPAGLRLAGAEGALPAEPAGSAIDAADCAPAVAPWRIPWRDWKTILWETYEGINDNRLLAVAAGVVFYCLLALFPALAAFVSIYGLVSDPSTVDSHLALASGILPGGTVDILHEELKRLTTNRTSALSIGFIVSFLLALWSANAGVKAILDGLNVANDRKETRSFIRLNLVAFAFTVGGVLAAMLAVSMVVIAPVFFRFMGLGGIADRLIQGARWPVLLALVVLGLGVLYRYGPSGGAGRRRWLSVGAVAAAVLWLAASAALSWYIANFGNYDATYGSLGAGIGMMTWMWISMIVVLVGAELNVQIERRTAGSPLSPDRAAAGRRDTLPGSGETDPAALAKLVREGLE